MSQLNLINSGDHRPSSNVRKIFYVINALDGLPYDSGLRFDETVPVEEIALLAPELAGPDADDYEVVNLYAAFRVLDGLELYGRVENLLDEDYQEAPPYNSSGSAAYAGVRYSF